MPSSFLLDLTQCIGCQGCEVACKTGNQLPTGVSYINISERVQGTFPDLSGGFDNLRCYHCSDAACVNVCPTGALFQEDGLTRLNTDACSGCGYCAQSCPYGVPQMVDGVATKCDGCRDVVRAGGTPWCVTTCPSDALRFGERADIAAEAHNRASRMRGKYPNAQVYGESQANGLGVLMVLPDEPEALGLPRDPDIPTITRGWQDYVKPVGFGVTTASIIAAGIAGVIARRNHMHELQELGVEGEGEPSTEEGRGDADDREVES
ncbi:MAG: 4Fe-4S dicluster domain-containing protein [Nitriliruptoraceae bacterium]